MFKFCSLYSGSSGNSSLIQTENTKILVDVGESAKKIADALNSINIEPTQIDAILITHEHSDHTKGISTFSKKYNIPVYANKETWNSLKQHKEKLTEENIKYFTFNKFNIGDLSIVPFSIPHDAANPCGFNVYHKDKKISIATDIGHMTNEIVENLTNSNFVLLESNYDLNILKCSRYPYPLKQRISGPNGHLSNDVAGKTISYLAKNGLNTVMLGHLSKENNFPELAYKTVVEHLIENNINNSSFRLSVADRYNVSPIIDIG
ncbi:MAG: MBL fold metallo-hydrolase [Clostridia bacterium]|nr:MBL fold metallo-hydrolase [Clostridia bacterium]